MVIAKEKRISILEAKNLLDNLNDRIVHLRDVENCCVSEIFFRVPEFKFF
jgi:hypothetical protein